MRISTAQYFETSAANYQRNYSDVIKSQAEAASGIRVNTGADDPVGAARLLQLDQQAAMLKQYDGNATTVKNSLSKSEAVLDSIGDVLQRARELAVGAGNGTYTDADRQANAQELAQIEEQLLSLMNSKDENGQYLFSGSKSSTAPYTRNSDGTYTYNGDQTTLSLQVGDTQWMATNDTGYNIFEQALNTSRSETALTSPAVDDGRVALSNGQVSNSALYNSSFRSGEPYTVTFVSSTQLMIKDAAGNDVTSQASEGGKVNTGADAQTVNFRGVDLTLNVAFQSTDTDADLALTGHSFTLSAKADSFTSTRLPGNTSTSVVTSTAITDTAKYHSTFPSGNAVLKFKNASEFELYAAPLTADSKPVAKGSLSGNVATAGGVSFTFSDDVAAGDQFSVAVDTHQTQNILDSISQLRQALNTPVEGSAVAAQNFQASLASGIANLASGQDQLTSAISSIGARGAALDIQSATNESLSGANSTTTASIRDSDPAEVLTRLTLQSTMLEAAQLAFSKISALSLFNRL